MLTPQEEARAIIAKLNLTPHPETDGGHHIETYRAATKTTSDRSSSTAILFLLEPGGESHYHQVDADELWLWHAGSPLDLLTAEGSGTERAKTVRVGPRVLEGEMPHVLVKAGEWQAAKASKEGWALVSCIVSPGFEFHGFKMAEKGWEPGM